MSGRNRALPWIALVAVYLLWGSTYLGIRVAVETIPPYLMAGSRYLIAGLLMLGLRLLIARERPALPSRSELVRIAVTAVLLLVAGNGLLCLAETRIESGTAALLVASTPIWMLLFDALVARKMPSGAAIAGIALGSAGIAILVGKGPAQTELLFVALALIGSVSWALGSVYARGNSHAPLVVPLEMAVGGFLSIIVGLIAGEGSQLNVHAISAASLWGMLWLITGGAMAGYTAYAYVVRTLPTATVATYAYVNPVVAVLLGALVLREPITWNVFAGGAAVVASVVLILLGSRASEPVAQELSEEAVA
ncbi:MAG: EamA family transporter [Candidatus Baltobacteraceae bacterium]